jgi:methylthioribose-1-phosphate isomerase
MYVAKPIEWTDEGVVMLDQRLLPTEEVSYTFTTYQDVAKAIKDMVIRGAPAIGVAAAMGVAIGVQKSSAKSLQELQQEFPLILDALAKTRPTAVDLFWAIDRMKRSFADGINAGESVDQIKDCADRWKPKLSTWKNAPAMKLSAASARNSCRTMAG